MFQKINGKKSLLITLITTFSLLTFAQEKHLKNIKQLTFGGDNAEAYFSPKGDKLTLQVTNSLFGVISANFVFYFYLGSIIFIKWGLFSDIHGTPLRKCEK